MPVWTKISGAWKLETNASDNSVKVFGAWKGSDNVWIKTSGAWHPCYPLSSPAPATTIYSVAGVYNYVVPDGVSTLKVTVVGAGGGGGGFYGNGDTHAGGPGGSGGKWVDQYINVVAGETLTVTVGAGGKSANWFFNGNPVCYGTNNPSYYGGLGGTTTLHSALGSFADLVATGGGGGLPAGPGDNMGISAPGA